MHRVCILFSTVLCLFILITSLILNTRETWWPNGEGAGLWIERSGFEPCLMSLFLGMTLCFQSASDLSTQEYKWASLQIILISKQVICPARNKFLPEKNFKAVW